MASHPLPLGVRGLLVGAWFERRRRVAISGGFAEVTAVRVTLLADTAEPAEEIDAARARDARESARHRIETLGVLGAADELEACHDELARAEARLAVLEG